MKKVLIHSLFLFISAGIYSQTGPGGIGTTATNPIWYDASQLSGYTNGQNVGTWTDMSGNGNNATHQNNPRFAEDVINDTMPAIQFNGTNEYYNLPDLSSLTAGEGFLVFKVDNDPPASANRGGVWDMGTTGDDAYLPYTNGNIYDEFGTNTRKNNIAAPSMEQWSIYNASSASGAWSNHLNGSQLSTSGNTVAFDATPRLGANDNPNRYFDGYMAEFVLFNFALNDAQRIIMNNYFSSKYGIGIPDDKFSMDTYHGNGVAGIGREDVSNTHTSAQSGGIFQISAPSDMTTDGEYMLFGHDNAGYNSWSTNEIPSGYANIQRIAQEWRFDQTGGDIGTVTITIDDTDLPAFPSDYNTYYVLIDADGDFTSGATLHMLNASNQATGITITDGYYATVAAVKPVVEFSISTSADFEDVGTHDISVELNYTADEDITVVFAADGSSTATGGATDYSFVAGSPLTISAGNSSANIQVSVNDDGVANEGDETVVLDISSPTNAVLGTETRHTFSINDNDGSRTIDFQSTSSSGAESSSPVTITIETSSTYGSDMTVDYAITGGTATDGVDFTLASGTATITNGNTTTTIDLVINQDALDESNETVIITLSNPLPLAAAADLGTDKTYTYTINDDDAEPNVSFASSTSSASEAAGTGTVQVSLNAVSGQDVTVNFTVADGTATGSGTDYTLANGSIIIPAGSISANISPVITEDAVEELSEDFTITITGATGASHVAPLTNTFTIGDNDGNGYTGPGGVGDNTTNYLWWDASYLTGYTDGQNVGTWTDRSGNGNNGTHQNNPRFETNTDFNGHPAIDFNGTNEYYNIGNLSALDEGEIFIVTERDNDPEGSANQSGLWEFGSHGDDTYVPYTNGNAYDEFGTNARKNNFAIDAMNQPRIYNVLSQTNNWVARLDGTTINTVLTNTVSFSTAARVGANDNPNRYFSGLIAEVILYSQGLNTTQRNIVNNYLSSKYDISVATDYYSFDANHGNDVAGIGYESSSDYHLTAESAGILRLGAASDWDDGEYVLFGHDDESISSWTSTETPNSGENIERLSREWRIDHSGGDAGNFTVTIDTSSLPARSADHDVYVVMTDNDGNFASGATIYPFTYILNGEFQATSVDIDDQYYIAIGAIKPTIQFADTISQNKEQKSPASVSIELNYALNEDVSVDYAVTGGTATGSGTDYILDSGTATITAGSTSTTLSVTIVNDDQIETDETIEITLSNPSDGLYIDDYDEHTISINDDDNTRKIDFNVITDSGAESVGTVAVQVDISVADGSNPVTVDYAITGGTGTAGVDATASGTATITSGNTNTTFDLIISEDALAEDDETIIISLSNPSTNASLADDNTEFTYTITDNDADPEISWTSATSSGSETVGSATVEISLSAVSGQDITVDYTVANGTATGGGTDFTLADGTATIEAGNTSTTIVVVITEDQDVEGGENFTITLSNPDGASLVAPTVNTFTISDNDQAGYNGPGGVGDNSTNYLWWDASYLTGYSDGDNVGTWTDRSGNGNNGSHQNNPRYETTTNFNGKPAIDFNGTNEYYNIGNLSAFNAGEIFIVTERDNDPEGSANQSGLWEFGSHGDDTYVPYTNGNAYDEFGTNARKNNFAIDPMNQPRIYNVTSETDNWVARLDGTAINTVGSNTVSFSSAARIGANDNPNRYFSGLIAEVILYNQGLNAAQRIIVQNYLSSKYDISISDDKYAFDLLHGNDVAGIGRSGTDRHTAGESASILKLSSASSLDDGDFALFGHDNGSIASWTSSETPNSGSNIERIAREWRLDATNEPGTYTVSVDTATLPARSADYTVYMIMIDQDGNFANDAELYPLSLASGSVYEATGVTIDDQSFIALAVVKPVVEFNVTSSQENEPSSPATLTIDLNFALNNDVTVDYSTSGTATSGGTDFTFPDGTATITAGNTSLDLNITVINDTDVEDDETIIVTLADPSTGVSLGSNNVHTFTINDDDNPRKINFTASSSSGDEGTSPVTLTIQINSVDADNPTTVDYSITGGTGTAGVDATCSGTATILATESTVDISMIVSEDALDEEDETIEITLTNPTNSNLGLTNIVYTYTITDNDASPDIQFSNATYYGSETSGLGYIEIELTAIAGQDISVDYAITEVTATGSGTDFTLADGTATIDAGDESTQLTVIVSEDALIEGGESFEITLSSPSSGSIVGTNPATFVISDNDQDGYEGPAGVGDKNTVYFWYDASALSASDGDNVGTWTDLSGNNHDATHQNNPRFETTTDFNGKPAIDFNGTNEYYNIGNLSALSSGEIFLVSERDNDPEGSANQSGLWEFGSHGDDTYVPYTNGNAYDEFGTNARKNNYAIDAMDQPRIYNVFSATNLWQARLDGTLIHTTGTNTVSFSSAARLGANDNPNRYYSGMMAEAILFSTVLNSAQRIIVQNYLAAKYDITIADDYYLFESSHGEDVAGIGYEDGSNYHSAALSDAILKVSSPSDMASAGEYILFGHNDGDITSWTTTETPNSGSNIQRLAREWRLDETGDLGTITFTIDSTNLPARNTGYSTYVLMVDADGNFASDATLYPMSQINENFEATGIEAPDQMFLAIAVIKPEIQFTKKASQKNEPSSPGTMTVELNYQLISDVTVDYSITGTATADSDFILDDGTITITAGNTTALLNATIINDIEVESDETIIITLSDPSTGVSLGSIDEHKLSINDDDNSRKIKFSSTSSSGDEGTTPVTLQVEINNADGSNPTTVDYAATGGTATGGGPDYTLTSGTATIPAGVGTTTTFDIVINEDVLDEDNETIEITLSNPTNCNLDNTDFVYTYTINDNDSEPTIEFSNASGTAQEDDGTGSVTVQLSAISGQDVTCTYTVAEVTATSESDYNLSNGTVTIDAGELYGYINPVIIEDSEIEGGESFTITLAVPSGATLGTQTVHTFNIGDNDNGGYVGPGGVGDADNIYFWYDVSDMTGYSDGNNVGTLEDISGNNNDATHQNNPRYETTTNFNGNPAIDFNGTNEYYNIGNLSSLSSGEIFVVSERDNDPEGSANQSGFWEFGSHGDDTYLPYTNGNAYDEFGTTARKNNYAIDPMNQPRLYNARSKAGEWVARLDGTDVYTTGTNTVSFSTAARFGANDNPNRYFSGLMTELILFNQTLNVTQRTIIEHYLAAKHDLEFANVKYTMRSTHGNGVAGIGKEGASDFHDAAMSENLFKISSPSDLENGEYLIFGHNGGDITTWTGTEAPNSGNNYRRLAREWVLDVSGGDGSVGTVSLAFETDELPVLPAGYSGYTILVDQDGDFSSGAVEYPTSNSSGTEYEANSVTIGDIYYVTIATTRKSIEFNATSSGIFEPNGPGSVQVDLSIASATTTTVDYSISGSSTATGGGVDYTLSNGTVSIPAGNTTAVISIPTINDSEIESDETVVLLLANPSSGVVLGTNTTHTFNIQDDDNLRKINFNVASANGDEGTTPVTVQVDINNPDGSNATSADYTVSLSSTATGNGTDYTLADGTATIPAGGGTSTTFNITIIDDAIYEDPDETIVITLSNPVNCNLASSDLTYTYTINDNDPAPSAAFTYTTTAATEGTTPCQIEVSVGSAVGNDIEIDYTVADGDAVSGSDYSLANGSVTILSGSTSAYINATILDDAVSEPDEDFTITITGVTGASTGTNTTNTVLIADNDVEGYEGPGGVGDANSIFTWLDASDISGIADEGNVSTWDDISGNNNDAAQNNNPTYETTTNFNGHPAVEFNGTNEYYTLPSMATLTEGEVYIVLEVDNDPPGNVNQAGLWDIGTTTDDGYYPYTNGNIYETFGTTARKDNITTTPSLASPRLYNVGSAGGNYFINLDAASLYTSGTNTVGFESTPLLGKAQNGRYVDGKIAEFVVYNNILNTVQRKIINNYFASKYGLTLSANDLFAHDAGHGEDVAGIGRNDASNFHSKAMSDSILIISGASSMGNGDYLLFGHDDASISTWTAVEVPNTGTEKITREWRVDETDGGGGDGVGTITVTIDTANLGAHTATYQIWRLYVDSDGDFTTVDASYNLTYKSGTLYEATNVAVSDGDYISFAVAENRTDGDGTDFNDGNNWSAGTVPGSGETATIGAHNMVLSANTTIGALIIETGGSLDLNGFTLTLDEGTITLQGTASLNVSNASSHITYSNNGDQVIAKETANFTHYNNLTLSGSGTKTLAGSIDVNGNLTISNGVTLDVSGSDYDINLAGNWTNSGSFTRQQGTVTFDAATGNQTISGGGTHYFYDLTINKVTSGDVSLSAGVIVENELALTNGDIDLGSSDLTIESGATVSGPADANSYIQADGSGFVYRELTNGSGDVAAIDFPIGDATNYTPFTFDLNSGNRSSASISVQVSQEKHGNYTFDVSYMTRYFTMESSGITGTIDYDVSFNYVGGDVTGELDSILIGKFSLGAWEWKGSCAAGTCSATGFESFSDFFPGDPTEDPLPITLSKFVAELLNENTVRIEWQTYSETENDYFTLEKSSDGKQFSPIAVIQGAGNDNSINNYAVVDNNIHEGYNYYRLKQTDFDGSNSYSNAISVFKQMKAISESKVNLYPNPVEDGILNVEIDLVDNTDLVEVRILDLMGSTTYQSSKIENNNFEININQLKSGIYFFTVLTNKERITKRFIVKL